MKIQFLSAALLAISATSAGTIAAADGDPRLIMPSDIKPVTLATDERNPFERRVELKSEEDLNDGAELSEEDRVRQKFSSLEVHGGTPGARVLLSDMILEKGKKVAPVLPDQTIELVVAEITEDEVVLTWVSDMGKTRPRTIVIPYDLSPKVGFLLSGQESREEGSDPVIWERPMRPTARPPIPQLRAIRPDGSSRVLEEEEIVGQ